MAGVIERANLDIGSCFGEHRYSVYHWPAMTAVASQFGYIGVRLQLGAALGAAEQRLLRRGHPQRGRCSARSAEKRNLHERYEPTQPQGGSTGTSGGHAPARTGERPVKAR